MIPKFRAWQREEDEEYSRMIRSEQSVLTAIRHVYGGAGIATGSGFSDINNQPEPGRYELMQYIGLKDKNGKEIFEGDIVHAYSEGARLIGVIEYFDNAYCIKDRNGIYNALWINAEHYEVVGNIWEDSELVEETDE